MLTVQNGHPMDVVLKVNDRTFTLDDAGGLPLQSIEWEIPSRKGDDEGGD